MGNHFSFARIEGVAIRAYSGHAPSQPTPQALDRFNTLETKMAASN